MATAATAAAVLLAIAHLSQPAAATPLYCRLFWRTAREA